MSSGFLLEKWYMDVVTADGCAAIGYFATVRWRKFSFLYQGYILRNENGEVKSYNSFRKGEAPKWNKLELTWNARNFIGKWQPIDVSAQIQLLKNDDSFIDWNCMMPKGSGKIFIGGDSIEGLGYAEKMTLNILPWKLPITELYWGRFLCNEYSVVWIEWRGIQPKNFFLVNGQSIGRASVSNEGIHSNDLEITFLSKVELRSGSVGETIFKHFRQILSVFPTRIFRLKEHKWCGIANLTIGGSQYSGTYIHEHAIWP